jgi:hypothetical protein
MVKSTIEQKKSGLNFPKLMISGEKRIVLFYAPCKGTELHLVDEVGFYTDSWDMECFSDYEGSITLSNGII